MPSYPLLSAKLLPSKPAEEVGSKSGIEKLIKHIDGHAYDISGARNPKKSECNTPEVYWQLSSCGITVQYYTQESE